MTRRKELLDFMVERHRIYERRQQGLPKPWTKDPILQKYRFCNVYRELDKVTVWIREHIREPYADHPNLWFMLAMARQINLPETLREIMDAGLWPTKEWEVRKVRALMQKRKARGVKLYTSAYMLNAHGLRPGDPSDKAYFTCYYVLDSVWQHRKLISAAFKTDLQTACASLIPHHGWGTFTAAQVVADAKYTQYLAAAPDWWTWAAPGPGSIRGLDIVTERAVPRTNWLGEVEELRKWINERWKYGKPFCAQDMQNCLCEFSKYVRGYGKTHYKGV